MSVSGPPAVRGSVEGVHEADTRAVLDSVVEAYVLMDADGRITDFNTAAVATFGWSREEALGADMAELLVPEDLREAHRAGVRRFMAGAGGNMLGRRVELRAMRRDGSEIPIELVLSVEAGEHGPRFAALLHDISARKESQARLRRFEAIVASSNDAILSGTLDGRIQSFNPAAERLYGYSAAEMIGKSVGRLRPNGDLGDVAGLQARIAVGETVAFETQERRKDGELIDVSVTFSPLREEDGEITALVSVTRDITARNRAAADLAEARSRFEGAFAAATIGMTLVSPEGRLLAVNPALSRFLGRDVETLLTHGFQELTHPDDLEADLEQLNRTLAGEIDTYQLSKRYLLPDGGIVWGLLTVTLVRDSAGQPLHFVSQIEDITDRKTAEHELRRYSQQLEALSDHDPLTGLVNRPAFERAIGRQLDLAPGEAACSVVVLAHHGEERALAASAQQLERACREGDLAAHLGGGELALLLPGVSARTAATVARRAASAVDGVTQVGRAMARPQDTPREVVERARRASKPTAACGAQKGATGVDRLLGLARRQLGMPISFLSRIDGEDQVLQRLVGDTAQMGIGDGVVLPLADSHCARMLDGRISTVVTDLAVEPETRDLEVTTGLGLRAYAGVPVRLSDGEVYGTLCAVDTRPHPELSGRHTELLSFLGELCAELIEESRKQREAYQAEAGAAGVRTLLGALEARDFYTGGHSKEVVALATAVALQLGLGEAERRDLEHVALLHDVGKVGIPDAILQKQGPLDEQEWQLMRQHPIVGERIIGGTPGLSHLAPAMRAEHERWDGGGYPDGLAGEDIPLPSRITLACDALHAMTSDRPYRPAMDAQTARDELRRCSGTQFDPSVVTALLAGPARP